MLNWLKLQAMFWCGLGAITLLYEGEITPAVGLLGAMLGFAIGEANGRRLERAKQSPPPSISTGE